MIYDSYASMTGASGLAHGVHVEATRRQFESILIPRLREAGIDPAESSFLEIGAGWGKNLLALKELGAARVRGVDISPEQVALGRSLGLDALDTQAIGPGLATHLAAVTPFDAVLAFDVLEHLSAPDLEQLAAILPLLLRPGGVFVVQVPNDLAPLNPVRAGDVTHLRSFTQQSLHQLFAMMRLRVLWMGGAAFPSRGALVGIRRFLQKVVLFPLLDGYAYLLYGRQFHTPVWEPNLLAVARRES